jgi:phage terminase large subunit-like protein
MAKASSLLRRSTSSLSGELRDFANFCAELTLDNGKSFDLEPFELRILADYFDGVRETLVLLCKKNGKTTLMAALALYHMVVTPDAECVIAAASRDQAQVVLRQARGFIRRSESLKRLMTMSQRQIDSTVDEGRIRILASDEDTADGVIPSLAIVDELHRHKSSALYGVFRDGLGPRQGRMLTISTAGDDQDTPLGQMRSAAYALPGMQREGAYRYVRSDDFAMHEWALDENQDRDDLEVVKTANPASWQTIAELRRRRESPSMKPWQWARFACGVWMFGEQGAFSADEWKACEDAKAEIPDGSDGVTIGVDLGWRWDTTGVVAVRLEGESFVVGPVSIVVPPRDGSATDFETIWALIEDLAERFPHPTFVIDPEAGGEQLAQQIERELDAEVVTYSQKPMAMALAAERLSKTIGERKLRHSGDPGLTQHVLAAAAKPVGESWRLVKPKSRSGASAVIDAAVALAMALSVAQAPPAPGSLPPMVGVN